MKAVEDFLKKYFLLEHKEVDLNFFQIAGFPHYENVSGNVLSFYFKNDFVLKSFLNCISIDYIPSIDFVEDITREEETENNKRIDIVIYTNKYINWN